MSKKTSVRVTSLCNQARSQGPKRRLAGGAGVATRLAGPNSSSVISETVWSVLRLFSFRTSLGLPETRFSSRGPSYDDFGRRASPHWVILSYHTQLPIFPNALHYTDMKLVITIVSHFRIRVKYSGIHEG